MLVQVGKLSHHSKGPEVCSKDVPATKCRGQDCDVAASSCKVKYRLNYLVYLVT